MLFAVQVLLRSRRRFGCASSTRLKLLRAHGHLHPHVQRLVFRYFLGKSAASNDIPTSLTTILTTHSPHVASVAPIRSLVLLRHAEGATTATSTATASLSAKDEADLQRYIDVTRGELFFARGVIFVEGDAERFLIPAFAEALGIRLDVLGISVCSVGGTNFAPYVKLVGPKGLGVPHVILTDLDPVSGRAPLACSRLVRLLEIVITDDEWDKLDETQPWDLGEEYGYFVNDSTLEVELFEAGLGGGIQTIIETELPIGPKIKLALAGWVDDPGSLEEKCLLGLIERIGKGRFAQALAPYVTEETCPEYISKALEHIRDAVA